LLFKLPIVEPQICRDYVRFIDWYLGVNNKIDPKPSHGPDGHNSYKLWNGIKALRRRDPFHFSKTGAPQ